jgi:hypothetical protein
MASKRQGARGTARKATKAKAREESIAAFVDGVTALALSLVERAAAVRRGERREVKIPKLPPFFVDECSRNTMEAVINRRGDIVAACDLLLLGELMSKQLDREHRP